MREESRIEFGRNRLGRRISWSAILAGVAATLGVSLLLALLGTGLGASSVKPLQEQNPLAGIGMGALIWMTISGILAFFVGGWIAAYGSAWFTTRWEGLTHGLLTWAVASLIGAWMITGAAGTLLSGTAGLIGQAVSGAAHTATQSPELSARVREELEKRGIDVRSLQRQAQSPETQAQAEQMTRQAGETAARGISRAALGAFVMLLLDLLASLFGALMVTRRGPGEVTAAAERVA